MTSFLVMISYLQAEHRPTLSNYDDPKKPQCGTYAT